MLDTVIELILDKQRSALREGSVLVDPTDPGQEPRVFFFLEQTIRDAAQRPISQEVHFVEIDADGASVPVATRRTWTIAPPPLKNWLKFAAFT
ncbi:MAG: hypothetical protein IPK53_08335 [bacterium]|nr:hypothetical protein [bacterium]